MFYVVKNTKEYYLYMKARLSQDSKLLSACKWYSISYLNTVNSPCLCKYSIHISKDQTVPFIKIKRNLIISMVKDY